MSCDHSGPPTESFNRPLTLIVQGAPDLPIKYEVRCNTCHTYRTISFEEYAAITAKVGVPPT